MIANVHPIDIGVTDYADYPVRVYRVPPASGDTGGAGILPQKPILPPLRTVIQPIVRKPVGSLPGKVKPPTDTKPPAPTPKPNPPPAPNPATSGTSDPVLSGILDAINGGGGVTLPAGQGLAPSGLIGNAPVSSGGSNPAIVLVVLAVLGILGYYLWEKHKGKLAKHEETTNDKANE